MNKFISSATLTAITLFTFSLYGSYCPSCPKNRQNQPSTQAPATSIYYDKSTQPTDLHFINDGNKRTFAHQKLETEIHNAIHEEWTSKGSESIRFIVDDGNVTLTGKVRNQGEKDRIENKIKTLNGVRSVDNQIEVLKTFRDGFDKIEQKVGAIQTNYPLDQATTSEDGEINTKIRQQLSGWLSKGNKLIIIKTSNGVVTLMGVPDNVKDIPSIIEKVKAVNGVKEVNDQLSRTPQPAQG
ncbi:MAG: BON domain-containing protein [Parachlamydiaceae bacterium]